MTTMDLMIVLASAANVYDRVNKAIAKALVPVADDLVDLGRWLWRARVRRKDRKPGGHRAGEGSFTVWTYFDRMDDRELEESTFTPVRASGRHRDTRGWRYAPATWKQIPVWEVEREVARDKFVAFVYWDAVVDKLICDINYMLANPPEPEPIHDCKSCTCGLVAA